MVQTDTLPMSPEALVEQYEGLVYRVASRIVMPTNAVVAWEDLIAAGFVGLLEAARRHDPARGVNFMTFAYPRVRGAMFDSLRYLRVIRRNGRNGSYPAFVPLVPTAAYGTDGGEGSDWNEEASRFLIDPTPGPDEIVEEAALRGAVHEALCRIPPRLAQTIRLYYLGGLTWLEVGRALGVSESRALQLGNKAVVCLRAELRGWEA